MDQGEPSLQLERLLAHERFVRTLAAQLVLDEARADDVVQQTWLAALATNPTRVRAPRAWLAGVVRHLARRLVHAEQLRELKERAAARPEALPSLEESMRAETARRELVDAVFALEEPWRTTLVLRFLDELPRREIARRTGVPVETVRSRLRRGLELLRQRLDRGQVARRREWCLALVPLAARHEAATLAGLTVTATMGVLAMSVKAKVSTSLAVIAATVIALQSGSIASWIGSLQATREGTPTEVVPARAADRTAPEPASPAAVASRSSIDAGEPLPAIAATTGSLEIVVRVAERTPAQPMTVEVAPLRRAGGITRAARMRTDETGAARFFELRPGDYAIRCDRQGDRAVEATVVAGESSRAELDLAPGFSIEGEVVDGAGRGVVGAEICLSRHGQWEEDFVAAVSDRDGKFAIADVSGLVHVGARKAGLAASPLRSVFGDRNAAVRTVRIVLDKPGGAIAGRVLGPDGAPLADASIVIDADGFARATLADGSSGIGVYERRLWSDVAGEFRAESIAAGEHRVVIRNGELMPFATIVEVEAGGVAAVAAVLTAGATVVGTVRTERGDAVAGASVSGGRGGTYCESSFGESDADGRFRLAGLPAGRLVVHASARDRGDARASVTTFAGTESSVELVLRGGLLLRGRVLDEADVPIAGAEVLAGLDPEAARTTAGFGGHAIADELGSFEIANCPADVLQLVIKWPGHPLMPAKVVGGVRAADGEAIVRLERSRRPSARIAGRVVDGAGAPLAAAEVLVMRCDGPFGTITLADEEGRFESALLAPDAYRVQIRHASAASFHSAPLTLGREEVLDLGELRLGRGGSVEITLASDDPELVARAWCFFVRESDDAPVPIERDGERLVASRLAAGRYRLSVGGPGVAAALTTIDVGDGGEHRLEVLLERGVPLTIEVAADDRSLRTVSLSIESAAGDLLLRGPIHRDAAGSFTLELALAPGEYVAVATAAPHHDAKLPVEIPPTAPPPQPLTLQLR